MMRVGAARKAAKIEVRAVEWSRVEGSGVWIQ